MSRMLHTAWYMSALSRLAADQRGVTAIITGMALTIILGFAGLAVDVAYWLNATRGMQAAADAATYSAATAAGSFGCSSTTAVPQAIAIAAARGYGAGGTPTTVSHTTTVSDDTTTLTITCTPSNSNFTVKIDQQQPMWFARLFMSTAPIATVSATAQLAGTVSDLCILALDGTSVSEGITGNDANAFWLNGNTTINVACGVAVDSTNLASLSTGGSSGLTATSIYLAGDNQGSPGGSSTIATSPTPNNILRNQIPVQDPYAGRVVPSYSCGAYSMTNFTGTNLTQSDKSPGASAHTFCGGLNLGDNSGARVTINVEAGVYIIAGGSLNINSKADVRANGGVTFVLTGDNAHGYATITVNGQSTLELTAPTSGPYGGMAFFQDRNAPSGGSSSTTTSCGSGTSQNQLNGGGAQLITGAVYFPNQSVCYGGGSSTTGAGKCTQLIAHTLSFTGNSDLKSNCAGTGVSPFTLLTPQLIR